MRLVDLETHPSYINVTVKLPTTSARGRARRLRRFRKNHPKNRKSITHTIRTSIWSEFNRPIHQKIIRNNRNSIVRFSSKKHPVSSKSAIVRKIRTSIIRFNEKNHLIQPKKSRSSHPMNRSYAKVNNPDSSNFHPNKSKIDHIRIIEFQQSDYEWKNPNHPNNRTPSKSLRIIWISSKKAIHPKS